ncbi:MAG: zf-HC2 domain-containing protein, partial [Acidobacteriota bacterium]|nr:zf-HC2 domain-containing protein [Acidobacteriota bacterium]
MTDRFRDRLSEFHDGELDASEEAIVRRHLDGCDECADALADLAEVAARAGALTDRELDNDLWPGIEARIADDAMGIAPL